MRLPNNETDAESDGPNLTPIIDIVFLLLAFFLVATQFKEKEREVDLRLAEVLRAQPLTAGAQQLVININKKGEYIVMGMTVNERILVDRIHDWRVANSSLPLSVQIRADRDVRFKYPLTVVGICKNEELDYSFTVLEEDKG